MDNTKKITKQAWLFNRYSALQKHSTLLKVPTPAKEKHPHKMMMPPPYFTVGMVFVDELAVLGLYHT